MSIELVPSVDFLLCPRARHFRADFEPAVNVSLLFITAVNFCRQSWQSPCSPTFPVSRLRIDGFNTAPGLTGWVQKYFFPKAWMRSRKRAFPPAPLPFVLFFSFVDRGERERLIDAPFS